MASLREDLLYPGAYPGLRTRAVELRETHISWVFLTEADVFKVKKPVDLGFLDFSTLEKRRAACEAEILLNARLAPGVYYGVVPVRRREDGRHEVGSEGVIVDWAVHMRRLPDAWRADERLRSGDLGDDQIDALAARLAAFHAGAPSSETIARFGEPDVISRNVEENFAQMGDALRFVSQSELADVERFQRSFLRDERDRFASRIALGRVRDGHGDLRLEHVYFDERGELSILDGIEFNERFRFGDVCADIAFLAMDLAYSGRVDLAERFVARYAREADDYDLYPLLDFYESYRAVVRAKISMMLAADEGASLEARSRADAATRRFLMLARAAPRRPLVPPMVVAVGGVIASGKSTIADALAAEMGAPIVDADRTRKHLVGVSPTTAIPDSAWSGAYEPRFTEAVYGEVLRRAGAVLASGRAVVIDASFRSVGMRRAARDLAQNHGAPFLFIECVASGAACRARLLARSTTPGVSDGRLAIFDDFCARFEAVDELPAAEHTKLDTERPLEESLAILRKQVAVWIRGGRGIGAPRSRPG